MPTSTNTALAFLIRHWEHLALWSFILTVIGLAVGLGLVAPTLPYLVAVPLGSLCIYALSSPWIAEIKNRGLHPTQWALLRAGRLGIALAPMIWLALMAATLPWSAPILLALTMLTPLTIMVAQLALKWMVDLIPLDLLMTTNHFHDDTYCLVWTKRLLWLGADINETLLSNDHRSNHREWLVENGANLNATFGPNRTTLLMVATRYHKHDRINWLCDHGADVHAKDANGHTALLHASLEPAQESKIETIVRLIHHGSDPNALIPVYRRPDQYLGDWSLLAWGTNITRMDADAIALLITNGADINAAGVKKDALLRCLAPSNHTEAAKILCENGANPNAADALTRALKEDRYIKENPPEVNQAMVRLLIEYGADLQPGYRQLKLFVRTKTIHNATTRYCLTLFSPQRHKHYRYEPGPLCDIPQVQQWALTMCLCQHRIGTSQKPNGIPAFPHEMLFAIMSYCINLKKQERNKKDNSWALESYPHATRLKNVVRLF